MLKINHLNFSYGGKKILKDLHLSLAKGEIGTLLGPSGAGKSTLFKTVTGLCTAYSGSIEINGDILPKAHDHIACLMQNDLLLPWRDVLDNATLLSELGKQQKSDLKDVFALLEELQLSKAARFFPDELSAGMQQRVLLARALLQKRPLLLLDEPFSNLDAILREQMYGLLQEIRSRYGTTILMITHDFRDALSFSDRIFVLMEGRISFETEVAKDNRDCKDLIAELRSHLHQSQACQSKLKIEPE